jgi:hypothetical protein
LPTEFRNEVDRSKVETNPILDARRSIVWFYTGGMAAST